MTHLNNITQYYFDTFIVGKHHSREHLIAELKEMLRRYDNTPECARSIADEHLNNFVVTKLGELQKEWHEPANSEPAYWVNELGRKAAVEINTFGRIKPETLEMMLCMTDDQFASIMSIANAITVRIQQLSELASTTPLPENLPVVL